MNSFYKAWWLTLLAKLLLIHFIPISADEAYYWVWSQNPQLSYYDHPPAVMWVYYIGQFLPDFFNIRLPFVILGHLAVLVWAKFLMAFLSIQQLSSWAYLFFFSPLIGIGMMLGLPDTLLVLTTGLVLYSFYQAISLGNFKWYVLTGVSIGMSINSKYHAVLVILSILLYLLIERSVWKKIQWRFIPAVIVAALIACFPVWLWNLQNDWASFRFQFNHGLGGTAWNPEWTLTYLASQAILVFPLFFAALKRAAVQKNYLLLTITSFVPIMFFFLTSFKGHVEANWPALAFPSIYALVVLGIKNKLWILLHNTFFASMFLLLIINHHFAFLPNSPDKLKETSQYDLVLQDWNQYQPFYGATYQISSYFWLKTKQPVYKLREMARVDYFDYLGSMPKEKFFYVLRHDHIDFPKWLKDLHPSLRVVAKYPPGLEVIEVQLP